jgi:hypothetical protein
MRENKKGGEKILVKLAQSKCNSTATAAAFTSCSKQASSQTIN